MRGGMGLVAKECLLGRPHRTSWTTAHRPPKLPELCGLLGTETGWKPILPWAADGSRCLLDGREEACG